MVIKEKCKWQYGDFQTPLLLAEKTVSLLKELNFYPNSIIEPTCGKGNFLIASYQAFPESKQIIGLDINKEYVSELRLKFSNHKTKILEENFFNYNWKNTIQLLPEPILIVGNPPWVTNSELSLLGGSNLPQKSNFQERKGLEAITGKSNFDISEWMLLQHLEWLQNKSGVIAMLCKSTVARKILLYAWKNKLKIGNTKIYKFNALQHFDANVDACFFIIDCTHSNQNYICEVHETLNDLKSHRQIGYDHGHLISNFSLYNSYKKFINNNIDYVWRSGIKHDCAKVMELEKIDHELRNGFGDIVQIEENYLFPLYKSSDISGKDLRLRKYLIVTQKKVGDETNLISVKAPQTWAYLLKYADYLDQRRSSIYKNKPRFSIFGVGDYSFYPWKVAISGFYKQLEFKLLSPVNCKPAMVDDTIYFLGFQSETEAQTLLKILNSESAQGALQSMIFWDEKRPITIELLKRLDILSIVKEHDKN